MSDWGQRLELARQGLAPALSWVGDWVGEGQAHGEPVTATLSVRAVLDGTQLEVWERVTPTSAEPHEDVCFYRYDVGTAQIRVVHLMAPALVAEYGVELAVGADGTAQVVWITPANAPAVVWSDAGNALISEVYWPDQRVAEVRVTYRRAPLSTKD